MNVLVTGGAGFIGTNLIKELLNNGDSVTSIDNYHSSSEENHQSGAIYYNYDIRNIKDYSAFGDFNVVYHLAAIARIQPSFVESTDYFETNVNGTFNVINYCVKHNVPLIYAGSSSHHGGKFKNPYTFTKDMGEELIKLYQTHFNLKSSIARLYNVYGPYQIKEGKYSTIIGKWEKLFNNKKPLTIYGDGSKRRDFTHVNDIVEGLIKISINRKFGYVFELGRGKSHSISDVANMFGCEVEYLDDKLGETLNVLCDNEFTKEILDWEPKIDIQDYIKNIVK